MPATREQIALTFMGIALRVGYRRASVADVARALHISKKTVYDFFESKEQMYEYAVGLAAIQQRRSVESRLTATSVLGRIEQVVRIALDDARTAFESAPLGLPEPPEVGERVTDRVFRPLVRDLIEQGVAIGEFQVDDVDLTSRFAMAIGMEAVRLIRDDPASHPEEAAVEAMSRLVGGRGTNNGQGDE